MKSKILLISLFFLSTSVLSQTIDSTVYYVDNVTLDTLSIYESKMNMPRKNYFKHFTVIEKKDKYTYKHHKFSEQDSAFFFKEKKNLYIKYYKNNTKRIEGRIEDHFVGVVKYYDKKGKLEREEYWNNILYFVRDKSQTIIDDAINWDDSIFQCGVWKYYTNSKLVKRVDHQMQIRQDSYVWSKTIKNCKNNRVKIKEIIIPIDSNYMDKLTF